MQQRLAELDRLRRATQISLTVPARGAAIGFMVFIASTMKQRVAFLDRVADLDEGRGARVAATDRPCRPWAT